LNLSCIAGSVHQSTLLSPSLASFCQRAATFTIGRLDTWIVTQENLRELPHVRAAFDHLAEAFRHFVRAADDRKRSANELAERQCSTKVVQYRYDGPLLSEATPLANDWIGEGFRTPAASERPAVWGRRPEAAHERTRGGRNERDWRRRYGDLAAATGLYRQTREPMGRLVGWSARGGGSDRCRRRGSNAALTGVLWQQCWWNGREMLRPVADARQASSVRHRSPAAIMVMRCRS
jgi:hypothetical protein